MMEVGPARLSRASATASLYFRLEASTAAPELPAMTPTSPSILSDLVALSLLPHRCTALVAERLRGREPPRRILETMIARRWPEEPGLLADVRARAHAALERAR